MKLLFIFCLLISNYLLNSQDCYISHELLKNIESTYKISRYLGYVSNRSHEFVGYLVVRRFGQGKALVCKNVYDLRNCLDGDERLIIIKNPDKLDVLQNYPRFSNVKNEMYCTVAPFTFMLKSQK